MAKFMDYPGAAHAIDVPKFGAGTRVVGMLLAYDRNAARRSWTEPRSFLAAQLGL
jgi:dienelactone hydrolase